MIKAKDSEGVDDEGRVFRYQERYFLPAIPGQGRVAAENYYLRTGRTNTRQEVAAVSVGGVSSPISSKAPRRYRENDQNCFDYTEVFFLRPKGGVITLEVRSPSVMFQRESKPFRSTNTINWNITG